MTLDELFEEIEQDLNLTYENLQEKLYKIPSYHSKYLKLFFQHKSKLNKYTEQLNKMYKDKYYYFTNEYEYKLDNAKEINFHILSDDEYASLNTKVENQKLLVDCLDRTVKRVQYMGGDCKNIITYLGYQNGC